MNEMKEDFQVGKVSRKINILEIDIFSAWNKRQRGLKMAFTLKETVSM